MIDSTKKAAIAAKIRALLAKTVDAGCTESEALAAADMVGRLLDQYGLEMSEIEVRAERAESRSYTFQTRKGKSQRTTSIHESAQCWKAVAEYTSCECWRSGGEATLNFFGLPHDVEIAVYLLSSIESAMNHEFRKWRKGPDRPTEVHGTVLRASFMAAMANRICAKLRELLRQRTAEARTSDGRSLVLVKNAVVKEQWAERAAKMNLKTGKVGGVRDYNADAAAAGRAAGDRFQVREGVASRSGGAALIGRN